MLTVFQYGEIRRAHRDGMSIREIARTFHHSRQKIRQVLAEGEPRPYTRTQPPLAPVLGPFHGIIDAILAEDEKAPPKQRHRATQIFRRLRDEQGYRGSYDQVRRYVGQHRRDRRETFIPLAHDPGQRLEADFGHIYVDFPDGRKQVPVLVTVWSYSNYPFVMAMPSERTEAILAGMVEAFNFFACVPHEVWWDNPRTVASQIFSGRERRVNERYAALASHYAFDPLFCMPARGNEKPYAETRVRVMQQQWATPVPRVANLDELNALFRARCLDEAKRTVAGYSESIGQRSERDRAAAVALPGHPFDACVLQPGQVDKYQTVRFDRNRYSVPRACAFQTVMVKGYIDRIEVVAGGDVVARHQRSYGRDEQILDPLHYLAALGRRPAALDHAPVLRDWQLAACFTQLREALDKRHGKAAQRQFARVLQLLGEHPMQRVQAVIEVCLAKGEIDAERIMAQVRRRATLHTHAPPSEAIPLCQYQVPRPQLSRFDLLLSHGDREDEREPSPAPACQSQAIEAAHHGS
jgi:transposase